jgi:aspartate/methionine/tyrosine aminotransferase
MRNINEGVCFSAPSVSQRAALHALRMKDKFQQSMIDEYKERVNYAYERIKDIPNMSVMKPQGSFYMFVNIKKTGLSSSEVTKKILEDAHVLTIPGNAFGESGEGYIRIACTVPTDKLKEAFDRIEKINIFSK